MATLSPDQIAQVAHEAGFRGDDLVQAVAVALAESEGKVDNISHHPGEDSRGLWQINEVHFGRFDPQRLLTDPLYNAQAARTLFEQRGNFGDWSVHPDSGTKYSHMAGQRLDEAAQAASQVGDGSFDPSSLGAGDRTAASRAQESRPVEVPGVTTGGSVFPDVGDYPTEPLPLTPDVIRAFAEERRQATRALQEAKADRQVGRARADSEFTRILADLEKQREEALEQVDSRAAARNMSFQPSAQAIPRRELRNVFQGQVGEAANRRADQLSALEQAVNEAERRKGETLGGIDRERGRQQSDVGRLLGVR